MRRVESSPRRRRTAAVAVVGGAGLAGGWWALAVMRPGWTFHLAPAVIVWTVSWLAWPAVRSAGQAGLSAGGGGLLAAVVAVTLAERGLLAGPWLFAGSALGESLVVIVAATAVAAVVGAVAVRRSVAPTNADHS